MKLQWIGHAMFVLTSEGGTRVVTDPFEPGCFGGALKYDTCGVTADVVTVSHDSHADHNAVSAVGGDPVVFGKPGAFEHNDVKALGVATFHDDSHGSERGENTAFRLTVDNIAVVHLGDLGHDLTGEQVDSLGKADILLAPFGGHFTIDGTRAFTVAQRLEARIVVPMHFKTPKVDFPIQPVEDFLADRGDVKRLSASEVDIRSNTLPESMEVWVMDYAG